MKKRAAKKASEKTQGSTKGGRRAVSPAAPPQAAHRSGKPIPSPEKSRRAESNATLETPDVLSLPPVDGRGSVLKPIPGRKVGADSASESARSDPRKGHSESESSSLRDNRESATSQDPIQFPEEVLPPLKTFLNAKQLEEFKDLLLTKRAELSGDVERLASEALNRREHGFSEQSSMPIHMADLGSDNWEQDFTLGLLANEQTLMREIDESLQRIEDKTYGMCLATGARIGVARLRAKPWAKYCIEYARAREEGRAP